MWRLARQTVRRARQQRLPQVAGSLTFTTVLSVVPFLTVAFALFTRFPVFRRFEAAIEQNLLAGLLPPELSRTVMRYLHQFADNASGLTLMGSLFLGASAIALLLTIENALNQIWDVRRPRPLLRRIGLHAAMLAVGPLVLGVGLWAVSAIVVASLGRLGALPPEARFALTLGPMLLAMLGLSAMFRWVPHASVRWRHALVGGALGALLLEGARRAFSLFLMKVPTYKAVYGAFATVPVFLLWVYLSWLVTLAAAVVAASFSPSRSERGRRQ